MNEKTNCVFDEAYIGRCSQPVVSGERVCTKHAKQRCWCGEQATRTCSVASSFVCGAHICDKHDCRNVASGLTGSPGFKHSKRGYRQYEKWKKEHGQDKD